MDKVKIIMSTIQDRYKVPVEVMTMIMSYASTRFRYNYENYNYAPLKHSDCGICMNNVWPPLHYHEIFTCNFETWLIDSYEYINVDDSE